MMDRVPAELTRLMIQICEDLIVVQACLRKRPPSPLSSEDEAIVNELFLWASDAAIPSEKFADVLVSDEDPDGMSVALSLLQGSFGAMVANWG